MSIAHRARDVLAEEEWAFAPYELPASLGSPGGSLGLDPAQIAWLSTVYVMTNVSINLLLVNFRQQFGLRPCAIIFLALYVPFAFAHLFVQDFWSAVFVRAASGMTFEPLGADYLTNHIALYQALGGGWTREDAAGRP